MAKAKNKYITMEQLKKMVKDIQYIRMAYKEAGSEDYSLVVGTTIGKFNLSPIEDMSVKDENDEYVNHAMRRFNELKTILGDEYGLPRIWRSAIIKKNLVRNITIESGVVVVELVPSVAQKIHLSHEDRGAQITDIFGQVKRDLL